MIPRTPKQEQSKIGRFYPEPLQKFQERVSNVARQSIERTPAEVQLARLRYSLAHDFKRRTDGSAFRGREHGADAYSVGAGSIPLIQQKVSHELKEAALVQVRAQREAAEILLRELERIEQALDNSRGSDVFRKRQAEIRGAQAKIA